MMSEEMNNGLNNDEVVNSYDIAASTNDSGENCNSGKSFGLGAGLTATLIGLGILGYKKYKSKKKSNQPKDEKLKKKKTKKRLKLVDVEDTEDSIIEEDVVSEEIDEEATEK